MRTATDIAAIEACILRLFQYISAEVCKGRIPTPSKIVFADTEVLRMEKVTIYCPKSQETVTTYELVVPESWQDTEGIAGTLTSFMLKMQ